MPRPTGNRPVAPIAGLARKTGGIVLFKGISGLAFVGFAAITSRQLGPSGRGVFVLLITLASFAYLVSSLGVNVGGRILLVAKEGAVPFTDYLGLSLALAVFNLKVCLIASFTLLPLVDVRLLPVDLGLFCLLAASLLVQRLLGEALVAFGNPVESAAVEASSLAVVVAAAGVAAFAGATDVRTYLLIFIAGQLVQIGGFGIWLRRFNLSLRPSWNKVQWTRLVRMGFPGVGMTMSQLLTLRIDRYLVGLFAAPAAVGIYSAAATAPEFIRLLPMAVGQTVVHQLASGKAEFDDFRQARRRSLQLTLVLILLGLVLAPLIVNVIFGPAFKEAVAPLRILLLAEIGIAVFSIDGSALIGKGRPAGVATAATVGLITVICAAPLMIPRFGLVGAAWGSVVAYSLMGVVTLAMARRRPRKPPWTTKTSSGA